MAGIEILQVLCVIVVGFIAVYELPPLVAHWLDPEHRYFTWKGLGQHRDGTD
jgi:hypothetical protein